MLMTGSGLCAVSGSNFVFRSLNNASVADGQGSGSRSANAATFPALT